MPFPKRVVKVKFKARKYNQAEDRGHFILRGVFVARTRFFDALASSLTLALVVEKKSASNSTERWCSVSVSFFPGDRNLSASER